jgi:hypothetical protein
MAAAWMKRRIVLIPRQATAERRAMTRGHGITRKASRNVNGGVPAGLVRTST